MHTCNNAYSPGLEVGVGVGHGAVVLAVTVTGGAVTVEVTGGSVT